MHRVSGKNKNQCDKRQLRGNGVNKHDDGRVSSHNAFAVVADSTPADNSSDHCASGRWTCEPVWTCVANRAIIISRCRFAAYVWSRIYSRPDQEPVGQCVRVMRVLAWPSPVVDYQKTEPEALNDTDERQTKTAPRNSSSHGSFSCPSVNPDRQSRPPILVTAGCGIECGGSS